MHARTSSKGLRIYALFTLMFLLASVMLIIFGTFLKGLSRKKESSSESSDDLVVIIDAGHGGEDGGAIGIDGSLEKHINLSISKKLAELLESAGVSVRLTRTEDAMLYDKNSDYKGHKKALDFAKRLEIAQSYDNAIFVSIHLNSFPQSRYNGLQVYYSDNDPDSKLLADKIQGLAKDMLQPENNRKTKSAGDDIYLLHKIDYPAVLVECGFLSNPEECKKLGEEKYQRALALVIYSAIIESMP